MSVVANVAINVDSSGAVSKLRQVQTQAQATEKAFGALQSAIGALGVGFALTKVIADVKELDTNLRRLGTVGVDVAKISPALSKLSDELGGVASKAELAAASYQAASAGFSDTAGNINILRSATKAAVGGLADTQAVTEVLVKTLNSYGMSGNQAIQVTDSISKAVELGNQEWSDYTSQLGRVASIAALAGVSLDEVNAFIASATKNGATAEIAFTGLGATLNTLLQPTKESQEAAAKLGIQWNYGGLQAKGFTGLMAELAVAIDKDKEASVRLLGSQEAMRGAFAAASKDGKDFKTILEQIGGAAGKTDADFQIMKGSLENTFKALDTSFKNLSEALGKAFGPTIVIAIQDITKGVNGFADFMAEVPQPVMDTVGTIVKLIAQILLVQKAIQSVIALRAGVNGMLAATAASATAAGTAAGGAATKVNMLKGAMLGLLRFGLVTLAIEIVISGLGKLAEVQARMNAITKGSTKQFAEQVGGSATSRQEIENLKKQNGEERARRVQEKDDVRFPSFTAQDDIAQQAITQLDTRFAQLQTMGERARFATPAARAASDANALNTKIGATVGGTTATGPTGGTRGGGANKAASEAARQAEQLMGAEMQLNLARQLFAIENRVIAARFEGNKPLELARETQKELAQIAGESAAIKVDKDMPAARKLVELDKLKVKSAEAARALAVNIAQIEIDRNKSFDQIIADLDLELALKTATTEQAREQLRLEAEIAKLKGQGFTPEQLDVIRQRKGELATTETPAQKIYSQMQKDLQDLVAIENVARDGAKGIGDAFGVAFQSILSGSASAQEALAGMMKSIGENFLSMAAQIIAQQITMIIFGTIMKALGVSMPGSGAFNGTGAPSAPAVDFGFTPSFGSGFAKGGVFHGGQLNAYAKGGIVDSPTFFKFANGGQMANGLMGEAGPEAIMPLKRGADGSLGVQANGLRDAMDRDRYNTGSGAPVLNMSFETTNIGGVEYVSRDQLEQAMAETRRSATRDGAQRGMSMTLDKLQQSPSTRRRIGM